MECVQERTALSALLDGEDPGVFPRLVSAHLHECASCRAFARGAASLRGQLQVHLESEVPDLRLRILVAVGEEAESAKYDARLSTG